ncbi:hypothetical protein Sjap_021110 [Stephania japonica]|uniref:DYW domain-containing protein n=1 Tax=Stephania japonica TaxID=461633 RepID=A0AAP0F365_9MAGN
MQGARASEDVAPHDIRCTHARAIKTADIYLHNNLITLYSKSNRPSDVLRVFHQIPTPNVVSWTALISSTSNNPLSLRHFVSMLRYPTLPNQRTLATLLKTCAALSSLHFGLQLHSLSLKLSLSHSPFSASALINFYSKTRLPQNALKVFDEMPHRDEVSYSALIVGLAQNARPTEALSVFSNLRRSYVASTMYSVSGALSAAAELAGLEQCRIVHGHCVGVGLDCDVVVATALVNGYGKCGVVRDARRVFDGMLGSLNLVGWNAMLAGYAQLGDSVGVVELFDLMTLRGGGGVRPDELSFLAILGAFSNAGLVFECENWLRRMSLEYNVEPGLEHYTCVIGALARVGRLEEAEKLAVTMPYEPDSAVWRTMLSACVSHGETEMASKMGRDCHEAFKHMSLVIQREILVRDVNRYHKFVDGNCTCGDHW